MIQFQKGLGLHEFLEKYGTEEQCRQALYQLRWHSGYVCPACGNTTGCELKGRPVYQGHKCHHQASLTAGSIFHATKLPLKKWFLAIYLLTQRKKSISALQPSREMGVSYNTAWQLKHKLMQVMLERQDWKKLAGQIEMDDAYLGGSRNKIPFVVAVETTQDGRPQAIHLRRVRGFRRTEIARYAKASLTVGSTIFSDGLYCFRAVAEYGCEHVAIVTGGGRSSTQHSTFKWMNTMLGNVKNALLGTFHAILDKHVPRYFAEFEYWFNRRFDVPAMIERLLFVSLRIPLHALRSLENG
jgi:transposase-like protein